MQCRAIWEAPGSQEAEAEGGASKSPGACGSCCVRTGRRRALFSLSSPGMNTWVF